MKKPIVLCILDGCGIREEEYGNAFKNAQKDTFDYLYNTYPHTLLEASGKLVGLPEGQMGNSEVGHMNIGAGRIVYQPLELINKSIETKEFYNNEKLIEIINHTKENNSKLHVMGLISDGGVHSHINHLYALIDVLYKNDVKNVCFHLFTDGRDTNIKSGKKFVKDFENKINMLKIGKISTISGRYYAMDRDNNYDRIKLAYDAICYAKGDKYNTIDELFDKSYKNDITDEFIKPSIITGEVLKDNDGIIVFNYRPDRLRELFTAITSPKQVDMETKDLKNIKMISMMPIADTVKCSTMFENQKLNNTLGTYLDKLGYTQLRIAETEKYAHVTYFFDGGKEINLPNSKRILIASPKIKTYDLLPEMSAYEITNKLLKELDKDYLDVVILNYANGDMVGHTGNYESAVQAVEHVDKCLKKLYEKTKEKDGIMIITADHGNCDVMINEDNSPCTTHSTNKVPLIITKKNIELKSGKLSDIAPTILNLMNIKVPEEMNGESLIR